MTEIKDERTEGRYAAYSEGRRVGVAELRESDGVLILTHTEVEPAHEGTGVGSALARRAFDDARAEGHRVSPLCPFMREWVKRHPQYDDLVTG